MYYHFEMKKTRRENRLIYIRFNFYSDLISWFVQYIFYSTYGYRSKYFKFRV